MTPFERRVLTTVSRIPVGRVATYGDVARLAQCSPMTVSRVVNGGSGVREETRLAVEAAIKQLNYAPNRAARSLAGASQLRIALLYANPSASYLSELLIGCMDAATRLDAHLMVERCEPETDQSKMIARLVDSAVDGFLLPPPLCDDTALLARLRRAGTHAVLIGPGQAEAHHGVVMIDDYQAAYDMTKHILGLFHGLPGARLFRRHLSENATRPGAGLPVLRSLKILESQSKPGALKNALMDTCEEIESGSTLSEAMAKSPKVFNRLYINMIKAGEAGGALEERHPEQERGEDDAERQRHHPQQPLQPGGRGVDARGRDITRQRARRGARQRRWGGQRTGASRPSAANTAVDAPSDEAPGGMNAASRPPATAAAVRV